MGMRTRRARGLTAALCALAVLLLSASTASAHVLLEDEAENAAERYAAFLSGSGSRLLSIDGSGGDRINLAVDRYDSGLCRRESPHRRLCPVEYEGRDLLDPDCRLDTLRSDPTKDEDCFEQITCRQFVTVTLRGVHRPVARTRAAQSTPTRFESRFSVRGTSITCQNESPGAAPEPPPG